MDAQIVGLRVSCVVFALMALVQLCRLVIRPEVMVAGEVMALWPSAVAFAVAAALSLWMWKLSCSPRKTLP